MKYLFIINPKAGSGKTLKYIDTIKAYMKEKNLEYKIEMTKGKNHASDLVMENRDDFQVFVAVGGDGTNKEVAEGIIRAKKGILAILPLGTANDLAKVIYGRQNIRKILDRISLGEEKSIDVIRADDEYCFNIASVGFDAQVIVNYNNLKHFRGKIKYFIAVIYTIFNFKYRNLEIEIDGRKIKEQVTLLAMGNGKYYGEFFKILPDAKIDDGYLHICLIKKLSRLKIIFLAPILLVGKHKYLKKYAEFYKCEEILIISKEKIFLNLDGEIVENTKLAKLEIYGKMKIIY